MKGRSDWNANFIRCQALPSSEVFGRPNLLPLLAAKSGERNPGTSAAGTGHFDGADRRIRRSRWWASTARRKWASAARTAYPNLQFEVADDARRDLPYQAEFDAVFSNATLHWIPESETRHTERPWNALRGREGPLCRGVRRKRKYRPKWKSRFSTRRSPELAFRAARPGTNPWYYPSVSEYANAPRK